MTISIASKDFIQSIASVTGWAELCTFVKENGSTRLVNLVESGKTDDIKGVLRDIDAILPKTTDINIRSILETMKKALPKCRGFAIVVE